MSYQQRNLKDKKKDFKKNVKNVNNSDNNKPNGVVNTNKDKDKDKDKLLVKVEKGNEISRVEKHRYETLFNNYLIDLLNKMHGLNESYLGLKEMLDHCFLKYSKFVESNRIQEYLEHTYDRFQQHIKLIAEEDDFLFSQSYSQGNLRLITGLDLYNIWQFLEQESSDQGGMDKYKKIIWKSLHNLYVSVCLALGKNNDKWAHLIIQNLRVAKEIEKEIEEEVDEDEKAESAFNLPNIADFEKIFNSDNPLSQLINDVKNDLTANPEEIMNTLNPENKPPLEVIMGLFSGKDTDRLQSIATSISAKFENNMKQRGLSEKDLESAAESMKEDLSKIPGVGMLLSQLNMGNLNMGNFNTGNLNTGNLDMGNLDMNNNNMLLEPRQELETDINSNEINDSFKNMVDMMNNAMNNNNEINENSENQNPMLLMMEAMKKLQMPNQK